MRAARLKITTAAHLDAVRSDHLDAKTVIVIDVLRATSNMVTAFAHGCSYIRPAVSISEAQELQAASGSLLGGERKGKPIPGFDLGNSPSEYRNAKVAGRGITMTTTNGTRAIRRCGLAHTVLVGSFLNAAVCAEYSVSLGKDIVLLCAGTAGEFSLEDGLCAGYLVQQIRRGLAIEPQCNDLSIAMEYAYENISSRLPETLLNCTNGKRLTRIGLQEDVLDCCRKDTIDIVPSLHGELLAAMA